MRRAITILAFLLASVCSAQVDERCPGTALERGPTLLTGLDALKKAAKAEGYEGRLSFRFTVTDTGKVRDPEVKHPPQLVDSSRIKDEIAKLRFCPAVKFSRYVETPAQFDIDTR